MTEVETLRAEVKRLRDALEPFAKVGEWLGPLSFGLTRWARAFVGIGGEIEIPDNLPKDDDFRRAHQALSAKP